jgi:hypothetical protein
MSTFGNTLLTTDDRRPRSASTWEGFKQVMLATAINGEYVTQLREYHVWDAAAVEAMGLQMAQVAGDVWY